MPKFKIGDKVKFVKSRVNPFGSPDYWTRFVDEDKVYTVDKVTNNGITIMLKEDGFNFLYSPDWLDKVEDGKCEVKVSEGRIKNVIFNPPATIVFWTDGTKTVVKCGKGDKWDSEKGLAMACAKKLLGNEDGYHREIAKYAKPVKKSEPPEDTEELRFIVSSSCRTFPGCETCPCRPKVDGGNGVCYLIAYTSREHLLEMYHSFKKAGKLWKERSNA